VAWFCTVLPFEQVQALRTVPQFWVLGGRFAILDRLSVDADNFEAAHRSRQKTPRFGHAGTSDGKAVREFDCHDVAFLRLIALG